MDIKTNPQTGVRAPDESKKEERKLPSRSFKEVMAQKVPSRMPRRGKTVFDLAAKEKKKPDEKHHTSQEGVFQGKNVQLPLSQAIPQEIEIVEISLEVSALVEAMADYIKVESENGISKTTVSLGIEGSVFDGSTLEIDHYDTAPQSFNLQLMGTPEATELFLMHLGTLQASLNTHEGLKGFQIHLLPPILSERSELFSRGQSKKEKKKTLKMKGTLGSLSSVSKK